MVYRIWRDSQLFPFLHCYKLAGCVAARAIQEQQNTDPDDSLWPIAHALEQLAIELLPDEVPAVGDKVDQWACLLGLDAVATVQWHRDREQRDTERAEWRELGSDAQQLAANCEAFATADEDDGFQDDDARVSCLRKLAFRLVEGIANLFPDDPAAPKQDDDFDPGADPDLEGDWADIVERATEAGITGLFTRESIANSGFCRRAVEQNLATIVAANVPQSDELAADLRKVLARATAIGL